MGVKIFSCMGTLRIMKVQLAKITVTLLLIGHVTGQLIPYGSSSLVFTRQRNAWQEQIERVMKAEEELRRKALAGSPRSYTLAESIPATKEKYDTNEKIGSEEEVKFENTKRPIVAALKKKETRGKKTTSRYLEQAEN